MLQCFVLFSVWLLGQVSAAANPCTANPCGKNGFCQVRQQAPGYVCGCLPGHTGVHCKGGAPQCALGGLRNVCKNGGTCYIHGTKTLRCLCPPGYVGSKCEEELLELTCPADSWGFSMGKEPVQFSQSNSCTDLIAAVPKWNTMDYYRIYCQHFTNATSLPEQASQVRMSMCYEVDQGAVLKSDLCCKRTLKSDPNNIFVYNINGSDTDLCGRQETPCKTVKHALIRVPNGGTIYVMGSKGYSYKECNVFANAITIKISVELVGINNPVFECVFDIIHKGYSLFHIHSNNGLQKVTLNGLSFLNAVIMSKNVDLTVQNCYFMESSIRGKDHKFPQNLRLLSSNFESSHVLIDKTGPIDLKSQDSKFHNSTFTILAIENIKARFLRTNFTIKPLVLHMETSQSQNNALNLDIELNACEFRTVGTSGAEKDSNGTTDTQAALQLEYKSSQSRFSLTSKLLIQSCVFRDNSRAIGLAGFLREVVIKDTTFHNNSVEGNGGAIAFKIVRRASLIITNCDFSINKATAHSSAVVGQSGTLTGRGGAIYAIEYEPHSQMTTTSKIILANDRFVGNQADSKGGTLYFGEDIDSTIMGTRIMGASNATTKVEGELLYIQASAEIASSQMLTVTRPHRQISVISISGTSGNSYSVAANVQCPIGYNLTYSHGTMNMSEQSQNLQLICVTCDFGLVSLQQGEMNITSLAFVDDKVTLESTSNADTFTCKSCPNGAICEDDGHLVKMAPNHWGILKDGTLSVQRCPIGYCCTGDTCGTFSDCAENRGGVLCGQCANDFSPSFFSSTCVDNTTCSAWWLWILAVICGIIILSITIFNQQLFHVVMILWMPIWGLFKRCNCCLRCQSEHVDPNENEDKFSDNGKSMSNNNQERRPKKKGVRFDAPQSAEDLYKERIHEHYGYLDSVVYLLQTAFLIHISHSSDSDQMTLIIDELGKIAYNIANFRFLFEYPRDVCLFEGANRAVLEIVHAVVILVVFLFLSFAYVIYMCVEDSLNERPKGGKNDSNAYGTFAGRLRNAISPRRLFGSNLVIALFMLTKFTFQPIALIIFRSLNCVHVGSQYVLFMDGTMPCYETWQVTLMVYGILCVSPAFLVYLFAPGMLREKKISSWHFFLGCFFPPIVPIGWFYRKRNPKNEKLMEDKANGQIMARKSRMRKLDNLQTRKTVLFAIYAPFKSNLNICAIQFNWNGVLILQKLLLVLFFTLINDLVARSITIMVFCLAFLIVHAIAMPFRRLHVNVTHLLCLLFLFILSALYIPVGVFVELGYEVHPTLGFIHIIETVFIHWIPTVFLLLIFLTAFILGIIGRIRACRQAEVERSIDGSSIQETPSIRDYPSFNSQSTLYRMHEPMGGQTEIEASLGGFDLSPNRDPDMLDFEIELFSQGDEDIQRGDAGMHSISLGGVTEDMGHC